MKLNLLILPFIGVSVSASGIRGFVPIKGIDRRLATSKSSGRSKSASGGGKAVATLVSSTRVGCQPSLTRKELHALTAGTSKSTTSKSNRRLASTSKSKSSSSIDADVRLFTDDGCTYELLTGPSKSTSKSKERRRLHKPTTSSSKSSGGRGNRVRTVGDTTVRCVNNDYKLCKKCNTYSNARRARNFAFSSGSKSKGSSKSNRRLAHTPKSSSKSSSYDDDDDLLVRYGSECQIREVWTADFDYSSSKSSSKSKGS